MADIIHFLHGLFYEPAEVEEYIDFSQNEEFRKELTSMGIGQDLVEYGREEGREEELKRAEIEREILHEKMNSLEEKTKKMAQALISEGISIQRIAQLTAISEDDIQELLTNSAINNS